MTQPKNSPDRFKIAYQLALEAGEIIQQARLRNDFKQEYKQHQELVTSTDQLVDNFLIQKLNRHFPQDQFLTEESYTSDMQSTFDFNKPTWVIDPIDGTVNFALGHPQVAVSIAFVNQGQVQFGIVHCPFLNETFHAALKKGAYLNQQLINTAECDSLSDALIATGLPYDKSNISDLLPNLNNIITHARDIRRNGSAAIDLCWVACGRLQAYYETVQPWDMAAGRLIAEEAGAFCGHFGTSLKPKHLIPDLHSEQLLVCSPPLISQLKALLM
jgi:myo-inositol-1(or 4)-monophosphatase